MVFDRLKKLVGSNSSLDEDYVEVDLGSEEKRANTLPIILASALEGASPITIIGIKIRPNVVRTPKTALPRFLLVSIEK